MSTPHPTTSPFTTPEWEPLPSTAPSTTTTSAPPFWKSPFVTEKPILPPAPTAATTATAKITNAFNTLLPPHTRYLRGRLSRRAFLLLLLGATAVVALALGLGIGLGVKKSPSPALPLPGNTAIHTGDLTYYSPGPGFGSCGFENSASDAIAAVSHLLYDAVAVSANPNQNPLCGRRIRIVRVDERDGVEKSVDVEVVDRCTGCKAEDVDLSPGVFGRLAAEELGRVKGRWAWLE